MRDRDWDWVVVAGMWLTVLAMLVFVEVRMQQVQRVYDYYNEEIRDEEQRAVEAPGVEGASALPAPKRVQSI